MPKPIAFLDADILLHRAVSFVDTDFDGEEVSDWKQALYFFNSMLEHWLKEVKNYSDYYLVVSVGDNFRKGLYPEYKANRKDIKPHPAFRDLKNEILGLQATIFEEGIEADDLIGIRVTEDPKHRLAVSADKDFATIPCCLMIPSSHGRTRPDWHTFSEDEANLNWLRQALMGDTIDNYKGIPRCGPVMAQKILPSAAPVDELWQRTLQAFKQKGLTEDYALTMARLARILRHGEYNFETKEVQLWTPNTQPPRTSIGGSS